MRSSWMWGSLLGGLMLLARVSQAAESWPQFRGPQSNGLPAQAGLPTEWSNDQNVYWKIDLPGVAWSQPIVWDDRIYVTTAETENQQKPNPGAGGMGRGRRDEGPGPGEGPPRRRREGAGPGPDGPPGDGPADDRPRRPRGERPDGEGPPGGRREGFGGGHPPEDLYRWKVLCLDRNTGQVVWEQLAHEGKPTIATHRTNTYASETPITDGERLYCYFGMTGLYCYDLDGKLLWSKQLGSFPMMMGWGTGSSPALDGERLFLQCDNDEASFLVALDKRTGAEQWRIDRDEKSNWSTPYIWTNKLRKELVTAGGHAMRSYDPETGKLLWELSGVRGRCSATPVGTDELLLLGVGGGMGGPGPLVAIKAGASGDITPAAGESSSAGVAWITERAGPQIASPLVYENCVYVPEQRGGILGCYDLATGKEHYRQRVEGAKGFTSSPWAYDGKVFVLDEDGQTFVLKPGPEHEVLYTNKLDDMFWSSVAVAGDRLLLRGVESLYCIGK